MRVPATVADLPCADVLEPFTDTRPDHDIHEVLPYDGTSLDHVDAVGSRFVESAFSNVQFDHGRLRRSGFNDV
ncbi:hypothetical protein Nans01_34690 [Nocardiopsis ansamitocini]|uniref:Uncharacterized protein n=1 Tax=Nocardiopsis ansamitocini TaxID=1670832 RepID=A0A9W6P8V5_9ACTN|nr:hypothetical protein Nans01_34690 [Nocardiopsis ansamitocini]